MAGAGDKGNVEDICADIDRLLPELRAATPAASDNFPDRIRAREAEMRGIWALTELRNDRMRETTGISFRALDTSIRDCVEALIDLAGVTPKTRQAAAADSVPS